MKKNITFYFDILKYKYLMHFKIKYFFNNKNMNINFGYKVIIPSITWLS